MRGCTCRGLTLCDQCHALAQRAGVLAPPEAPKVTEKAFQAAIVRYAREHHWLVYHTHDSRRSLPGYPDLTLVRNGICIWSELKVDGAQPTLQQAHWLRALGEVRETAAFLWTPDDFETIRMRLT